MAYYPDFAVYRYTDTSLLSHPVCLEIKSRGIDTVYARRGFTLDQARALRDRLTDLITKIEAEQVEASVAAIEKAS